MKRATVVSLTASGRQLAERLTQASGYEHLHRPRPFAEAVRARFRAGRPLAMITAAGIAVRVLAPLLADKRAEPAVIVLDEQGRFVVPLLGGHQGGANEWAREISAQLGAQCVITTAAHYLRPVYVAGLGCERGCSEDQLGDILSIALRQEGLEAGNLAALASIELKRDETGLLSLGRTLGLDIEFFSARTLAGYTAELSEPSPIVFRETGCYGVAEAAALAQAEVLASTPAELVVTKKKTARATCAIARAYRTQGVP